MACFGATIIITQSKKFAPLRVALNKRNFLDFGYAIYCNLCMGYWVSLAFAALIVYWNYKSPELSYYVEPESSVFVFPYAYFLPFSGAGFTYVITLILEAIGLPMATPESDSKW